MLGWDEDLKLGFDKGAEADPVLAEVWGKFLAPFRDSLGEDDERQLCVCPVPVGLDHCVAPVGEFGFEGYETLARGVNDEVRAAGPIFKFSDILQTAPRCTTGPNAGNDSADQVGFQAGAAVASSTWSGICLAH